MMTTFYGKGAIWDSEMGKILGRFEDGKYSTNDPREIAILNSNGFSFTEEAATTEPLDPETAVVKDYSELNIHTLRNMAREKGVEGLWDMNKGQLIEALEAGD